MFKSAIDKMRRTRGGRTAASGLETLEARSLLSASPFGGGARGFGGGPGAARGPAHFGGGAATAVTFSQLSTAIQNGLTSLASTDGLTAPAATSVVTLGNRDGVETFSVRVSATGATTTLTVDQNGNPVTAPTRSSTTFGALTNTAVTAEISAIASALGLTAPSSTAAVSVTTPSSGPAVYTIALSTGAGRHARTTVISVDANGNPTGNESVPLSTLSTAIQNGLTSNAPAGATALASSSLITVRTLNGVTTYSATYNSAGTRTTVTVNSAGTLTSLPSASTVQFSAIPAAAQSAFQTLATAAGSTTTIAATQNVTAYDEGNGATVYSARVTVTKTDSNGNSYTYPVTLTVDAAGNPTVLPGGSFGGLPGGFGGGLCV
jgi:hypothetical protein